MDVTAKSLHERYTSMNTNALSDFYHESELTDLAVGVLEEEITSRGLDWTEFITPLREWEDFKAFIGPNAEKFRSVRTKIRGKDGVSGWCWPAFFFAFAWFFYRKMYVEGAGLLLLPIIYTLIFPDSDLEFGLGLVFAMGAKYWYLRKATKKFEKISQRTSSNETKRQQLQMAGGVSVAGGVIGGAIYAVLVGLAFLAAAGEA